MYSNEIDVEKMLKYIASKKGINTKYNGIITLSDMRHKADTLEEGVYSIPMVSGGSYLVYYDGTKAIPLSQLI